MLFSILKYKLQTIRNALYMRSDMVQTFIRVASDLEAASQGNYLYESGGGTVVWSADQKFPPVREIRILTGRSTMLRVGGGLFARYKPDFSYPGTIPPGRYAFELGGEKKIGAATILPRATTQSIQVSGRWRG